MGWTVNKVCRPISSLRTVYTVPHRLLLIPLPGAVGDAKAAGAVVCIMEAVARQRRPPSTKARGPSADRSVSPARRAGQGGAGRGCLSGAAARAEALLLVSDGLGLGRLSSDRSQLQVHTTPRRLACWQSGPGRTSRSLFSRRSGSVQRQQRRGNWNASIMLIIYRGLFCSLISDWRGARCTRGGRRAGRGWGEDL